MTTLQMQHITTVGYPVAEDVMEVTSEMDQSFDVSEDIDIDLDLGGEKQDGSEDETMAVDNNMLSDHESVQEHNIYATNDDEMADDGFIEGPTAERSSTHDEDLADAEDISSDIHGDSIAHTITEHPFEEGSKAFDDEDQIEEATPEDQEYYKQQSNDTSDERSVESDQYLEHHGITSGTTMGAVNDSQNNLMDNETEDSKVKQNSQNPGSKNETSTAEEDITPAFNERSIATQNGKHQEFTANPNPSSQPLPSSFEDSSVQEESDSAKSKQPAEEIHHESNVMDDHVSKEHTDHKNPITGKDPESVSDETKLESQHVDIAPDLIEDDLKTSIYMHPVIVIFQNDEICLFPPVNQEEEHSSTYFLQDERLAGDTIANLLGACRSVLGESISGQQELVIDIDELDLQISEFAPESSTTTLKDLTDIYVSLQHYDGQDDPPALYIQITIRSRFSHRLEFLMKAVTEEKGLSEIQPTYDDQASPRLENETAADPDAEVVSHTVSIASNNEEQAALQSELDEENKSNTTSPSENTDETLAKPLTTAETIGASTNALDPRPDDVHQLYGTTHGQKVTGESQEENNTRHHQESPALPPPEQQSNSRPQGQDESLENEDLIDYEDDDVEANRTSSGSSTLQGDVLEASIDALHATPAQTLLSDDKGEYVENAELAEDFNATDLTYEALSPSVQASKMEFQDAEQPSNALGTDTFGLQDFEQYAGSSSNDYNGSQASPAHVESGKTETEIDAFTILHADTEKARAAFQDSNGVSEQAASSSDQDAQVQEADKSNGNTPGSGSLPIESVGNDQFDTAQGSYTTDDLVDQEDLEDDNHASEPADSLSDNGVPLQEHGEPLEQVSQESRPETHLPADDIYHGQDNDDEITYDDDQEEDQTTNDLFSDEHISSTNSRTLKRARSIQEEDEVAEDLAQDNKRARCD
ncbi:hypothetical protein ACLMJK_002344 [Lecanora helva]